MKILITQEVYDKVMHWVNKSEFEVSGFGKVIHDPRTNTFIVKEAYLLKQENTAATTDIDATSLGKLMYLSRDVEGELKWWWHSHVNMSVFWSGTDTQTIKDLGEQGWITATVFNKKYEMRSAVGYKVSSQFGDNVQLNDNVECEILRELDPEITTQWDAEYDANVTVKKFASPSHWEYKGGELIERSLLSTEVKSPSAYDKERDDKVWGLMGYGASLEARAIGMGEHAYLQVLAYGTADDILRLETKLLQAEKSGELKNYGYGY